MEETEKKISDMPPPVGSYQVLARKYRPTDFSSLIGQDAMVQTLTNAFESKRLAHAYILTGVRGVGKTTTARIIAKALWGKTARARKPSIPAENVICV